MPEIAKITTQQKLKNRYNIFLKENNQDVYSFSVDEDILIEFNLRKGLMLTPETITQIKEQDESFKAYTRAIHYLSYRMRSEKELIDYLHTKEIEDTYVEEVIIRLKQEGLLDDLAFGESFVRSKAQTSSKGPLLIKKELIEKGIQASYIEHALTFYPYEKQYEKVQKWVSKKLHTTSKKSHKQQQDNIKQSLMQKGFSLSVILDVLTDMEVERDDDEEYQALFHQGEKLLTKHKRKESGFALQQKVKASLYQKGFPGDLIQRFIDENVTNNPE